MPDMLSLLAATAINYGLPLLLLFWYACRVRHPARSRLRAFLMLLSAVAVVPPVIVLSVYHWLEHDGSPLYAISAVTIAPFVAWRLVRSWLRRPPAVRPTAGPFVADRPGVRRAAASQPPLFR